MSYIEGDGDVILHLSHEDYKRLMYLLGVATAGCQNEQDWILDFLNRLNLGNPGYTPYKNPKAEKLG